MNPAPNHHPRTVASRAVAARRINSSPGTSATHASHPNPAAGKVSTGRAPAADEAYRAGRRSDAGSFMTQR
ncbi:hypothetical protein GCM10009664_39690 [Kitasatospora gansuensis]